jgi:hypothetical protein
MSSGARMSVNLLLRTAITAFAVPHGVLGFEVYTDYTQRTTLQGFRSRSICWSMQTPHGYAQGWQLQRCL